MYILNKKVWNMSNTMGQSSIPACYSEGPLLRKLEFKLGIWLGLGIGLDTG